MAVTRLGYFIQGIDRATLPAWRQILAEVIGAELATRDDGALVASVDPHNHLVLQPGEKNELLALGWAVADESELAALVARLRSGGTAVQDGTPGECAARGAKRLCRFVAPDGIPSELFVPRASPAAGGGHFVSNALGLGHVVLAAQDQHATSRWYRETLGFKASDRISWAGVADAYFMHCNPRHHSLAIINAVFGLKAGDVHHLMIEARSPEQVQRGYERLQALGLPLLMKMGEHTNDRMTSFYLITPAGFCIEYGSGGVLIENSSEWPVRHFDSTSLWGHDFAIPPPGAPSA